MRVLRARRSVAITQDVESVRAQLNPDLTSNGIVLTITTRANNLSGQVVADVREFMGRKVYDTIIPRNVPSRKRRPTVSRCWSTISNAAAAKPICGSRRIIQREKELLAS